MECIPVTALMMLRSDDPELFAIKAILPSRVLRGIAIPAALPPRPSNKSSYPLCLPPRFKKRLP